ncbi:MAG TPA: hypothetical protein VHM64_08885 [Candidatus Binatia bacterium]|nr:hypothetical protein [Candidatus Binatia bacterium]
MLFTCDPELIDAGVARAGLAAELIVNAIAGKTTHVVFCFTRTRKYALAGKLEMLSVSEIDVTVPFPCVIAAIFTDDCDDILVAV